MDQLERQVGKFVFSTNAPFSIVENQDFLRMMQMVRPGIKLPGRHTIGGRILDDVYMDEWQKFSQMVEPRPILAGHPSGIAIAFSTADQGGVEDTALARWPDLARIARLHLAKGDETRRAVENAAISRICDDLLVVFDPMCQAPNKMQRATTTISEEIETSRGSVLEPFRFPPLRQIALRRRFVMGLVSLRKTVDPGYLPIGKMDTLRLACSEKPTNPNRRHFLEHFRGLQSIFPQPPKWLWLHVAFCLVLDKSDQTPPANRRNFGRWQHFPRPGVFHPLWLDEGGQFWLGQAIGPKRCPRHRLDRSWK